ncbi:MAG: hypothetical protein HKN43_13855 [Rhodothermales bacterium]|nr:hypothetical protein [Rhodothermales bacterium]
MTFFRFMTAMLVGMVILMPSGAQVPIQDDTLTLQIVLQGFNDAVTVEVDPLNNVYVLDRLQGTITKWSPGGKAQVFGGRGSIGGQFESPSDLDATTGFLFLIADTGNGRIQRLGSDLVFLESLAPDERGSVSGRGAIDHQFEAGRGNLSVSFSPIALSSSPDGRVFAVDRSGSAIYEWTSNRQQVNRLSLGVNQRFQPTDLDVFGNSMFITDDSRNRVIVADLFGNELMSFGEEVLHHPLALQVNQRFIVVLDGDRLVFFNRQGNLVRIASIPSRDAPTDFYIRGSAIYLTDRNNLYVSR